MNQENKHFGASYFTPRERLILRYLQARKLASDKYLRWRYRDRIRFGNNVSIAPGAIMVHGLGVIELGDDVIIESSIHKVLFNLEPGGRISLGEGTWFRPNNDDFVFSVKPGAEITLGKRCWLSGGIYGASERITIGDHTHIGFGCLVLDSNLHRIDNDAEPVVPEPVTIGSHVWMPSYVTVLKGVTIGDHCVIGTGSLVTEDLPPNSFAAGRPAKVIRKIGDRDQVI